MELNAGIFAVLVSVSVLLSDVYSRNIGRQFKTRIRRNRRDIESHEGNIRVIRNETFECTEITEAGMERRELDDATLMAMLKAEGGVYVSSYMARSPEEAQRNFKHFVGGLGGSPNQHIFRPIEDNWYSKKAAETHMREFFRNLPKQIQIPSGSSGRRKEQHKARKDKQETRRRRRSVDQQVNVPGRNLSSVPEPEPEYLFSQCWPRRNLEAGHHRLCETCAVTLQLNPSTFYPHIFNGALCSDSDSGCLYVTSDNAHGECRQSEVTLNILRRSDSACTLALFNGETVIVDDWHLWSQPLGVGCECFINQYSFLSDWV